MIFLAELAFKSDRLLGKTSEIRDPKKLIKLFRRKKRFGGTSDEFGRIVMIEQSPADVVECLGMNRHIRRRNAPCISSVTSFLRSPSAIYKI